MILRQKLYDALFGDAGLPISTPNLYIEFLQDLPDNSHILDVGVGTGIYFENPQCISLIREKCLKIHGIDIVKTDIELAGKRVVSAGLGDKVSVECTSLFSLTGVSQYDAILFSESYPVIDGVLMRSMINWIVKINVYQGKLCFINNIEDAPAPLQRLKPVFSLLGLRNQFGRLVSRDDMLKTFADVGIDESAVEFKLLASATPNYALFRDKIKIPGLNFQMKQYLITIG